MSLTRQQKEQSITETQKSISSATSVVFISYDGLTVDEANELRTSLHEAGGGMRVIPKRLLKIVLSNEKLDFDPKEHEGQIAVVWGEDAVAPAKVLNEFAKDHDSIKLLAGALEGNILSLEEVTALAKLPSREELLGQLVGALSGSARGLVSVLSGVQRNTVQVLKAIADQKS
jgi:large subunit ribosomal protein L10